MDSVCVGLVCDLYYLDDDAVTILVYTIQSDHGKETSQKLYIITNSAQSPDYKRFCHRAVEKSNYIYIQENKK